MLLTSHIKEIMKNIIKKSEDHPKVNSTEISSLQNFSSRFDLLNQNISVISADLHNVKNAHLVDYKILMKRINKLEDKSMNETSETPVFKNGKKYTHNIPSCFYEKNSRDYKKYNFMIVFSDSMKLIIFCGKNDNISQNGENTILKYTEVFYQSETWLDVHTGIFTAPKDGKNF